MGISMDSLPPRYQKQAARKLDPAAYEKALQFFHAEEDKSPARQAQGSISHALGESFEAQILTACEYYRSVCHAEIKKNAGADQCHFRTASESERLLVVRGGFHQAGAAGFSGHDRRRPHRCI